MLRAALIAALFTTATPVLADHHNEALRQEIATALEAHEIDYDVSTITDSQLSSIQAILKTDDKRNEKRAAIVSILGLK